MAELKDKLVTLEGLKLAYNNIEKGVTEAKKDLASLRQIVENPEDLNKLISDYYRVTPDYGTYTVKFPQWDTSHTSTGEKLDDNAGLVLTCATDTVKEVNTYPHCFDTFDVNAYVDDEGVRHITAIKGDENFRDTGKVDVFVCRRAYWEKWWVEDGYEYYSRCFYPKNGYTLERLAYNRDGSTNNWVLHAKYMAGDIFDDNGTHKLYSSKGLAPSHYMTNVHGEEEYTDPISFTGMQPLFFRRGRFYTGSLASELKHLITTMWLKFATKNSQSILCGNTGNDAQYQVAEVTTESNRVVLTQAQANSFDLFSCVSVGNSESKPDRNNGSCHDVVYDARIIGKETLENGNVALILDHKPFSTTTNSWVTSFHEVSGYSDMILGRNGSPISCTNGKHGAVIDGIECFVGGYETLGNTIMVATSDPLVRDVYLTNDATRLSTSMSTFKANAIKSELQTSVTTNGNWNYITEVLLDLENGIAVNTKSGQTSSGSSVGYADAQYFDAITTGEREWLSLGNLGNGSFGGSCFLSGRAGVSYAYWTILARLSINCVG